MRNVFFVIAFLFSSFLQGCYLVHGLEFEPPPVPMGDAGPMIEPDAGPVVRMDAGHDAGADAFIPFDGDAGAGRVLVSQTNEFAMEILPLIIQPGYRNRFGEWLLCNSADERVRLSSLRLRRSDPVVNITRITLEQDAGVIGRLDRFPDRALDESIVPDAPISIPSHGCIQFETRAEITGLRSWAEHPEEDGTLRSGSVAHLEWDGICDDTMCIYVGDAFGESSGMPYELAGPTTYRPHFLHLPVRASAVIFGLSGSVMTVSNPHDIEAIAFDAIALGATAGFLRGSVSIASSHEGAIADAWLVMDGRRLSPEEASIETMPFGEAEDVYVFTLRDERVLEVPAGRTRSDPVRLAIHVALRFPLLSASLTSRLINTVGVAAIGDGREAVTGTLVGVEVTFTTNLGHTFTLPAPAIRRTFGPFAGDLVACEWLTSDHSEPDHGPASRDWNNGTLQQGIFDRSVTIFSP